MTGFKNFIMRGNLVELAVAVAARRCPQCTAEIAPATEQPQPIR